MAQISVDTNNDSIEELEHAMHLLEKAIMRRQGNHPDPRYNPEPHYEPRQPVYHERPEPRHESQRQPEEQRHVQPRHASSLAEEISQELQPELHAPEPKIEAKLAAKPKIEMPVLEEEETAIDTPFLKVTVKEEKKSAEAKVPTLNQLINESISEEELTELFKNEAAQPKKEKPKSQNDAFIEIVDYDEKEK